MKKFIFDKCLEILRLSSVVKWLIHSYFSKCFPLILRILIFFVHSLIVASKILENGLLITVNSLFSKLAGYKPVILPEIDSCTYFIQGFLQYYRFSLFKSFTDFIECFLQHYKFCLFTPLKLGTTNSGARICGYFCICSTVDFSNIWKI